MADLLRAAQRISVGAVLTLAGVVVAVLVVAFQVGRLTAPVSESTTADSQAAEFNRDVAGPALLGSDENRDPGQLAEPRQPAADRVLLTERSPGQVRDYLSSLAPLQRRRTADSVYVGSWVESWEGVVGYVDQRNGGYWVSVEHPPDDGSALIFELGQRAVVEPMREGDTIVFGGRIANALYIGAGSQIPYGFELDSVEVEWRVSGRARN